MNMNSFDFDEENNGHNATSEESNTQSDTCYHCRGYYGPSNGDPLCGTCHDFLYVEDFDISHSQQNWGYISQTQVEKDDGDSGNDEPSEDAPPISGNKQPDVPLENPSLAILHNVKASIRTPFVGIQLHPNSSKDRSDSLGVTAAAGPSLSKPNHQNSDNPPSDNVYELRVAFSSSNRHQERISRRLALLTAPIPTYKMVPNVDLTSRLPPEMWRMVFLKLDSVSLLLASKVRPKWKSIILPMFSNEVWESYVKEKWPLFNPIYEVNDWYSVFEIFLESLPCCSCWIKMNTPSSSVLPPPINDEVVGFRSLRSARLSKELKWLRSDHPDGIEAVPLDHLNYNWLARIIGPPQSPYQGGVFYLNIKIPYDYPLKPPHVRFLTKVYHPNISRHGDIGIDCIQHNWTLALFIPQTLLSVQSLLTDPCTEPCMEPSIAYQYVNDKKGFENKRKVAGSSVVYTILQDLRNKLNSEMKKAKILNLEMKKAKILLPKSKLPVRSSLPPTVKPSETVAPVPVVVKPSSTRVRSPLTTTVGQRVKVQAPPVHIMPKLAISVTAAKVAPPKVTPNPPKPTAKNTIATAYPPRLIFISKSAAAQRAITNKATGKQAPPLPSVVKPLLQRGAAVTPPPARFSRVIDENSPSPISPTVAQALSLPYNSTFLSMSDSEDTNTFDLINMDCNIFSTSPSEQGSSDEESNTSYCIPKLTFARLVRSIGDDFGEFRWGESALETLQDAAEAYLIKMLGISNGLATHRRRVTVNADDLNLAVAIETLLFPSSN